MSDERKPKDQTRYEVPMVPIFGVDLGEKLGSIDARLSQHDREFAKMEACMDKFDARMDRLDAQIAAVDGRVDKCLLAINRLGERVESLRSGFCYLGVAMLVAIIVQKLI